MSLRVISAYCTVAGDAATVIAGILPTYPLYIQCGSSVDNTEHTILECPYGESYRAELSEKIGDRLTISALSKIICGPADEDLPDVPEQRTVAIDEAMEVLRLFYRLEENLLSAKEQEERVQQGAAATGGA